MEQNNKSFLKWALIGILVLAFLIIGVYVYLKNKSTSTTGTTTTTTTTGTTTADNSALSDTNTGTTSNSSTGASGASTSTSTILNATDADATNLWTQDEKQSYAKAKVWNNAAGLCAASVKIGSDLSTQGMTYSYIYCATSDKTYYFNINYNSSGEFLRALIWKTDYIKTNLTPVSLTYLKISFFEALQTAENSTNGGAAFRASHPQAGITLNLYQANPSNYNYWFVDYQDSATPDKLIVQINTNSGQVIANQ
jgi:hypothetical protein